MTQILRVGLLQEAQRVYVEACLQMCLGPGKRNHIVTHKIGLKDLCRVGKLFRTAPFPHRCLMNCVLPFLIQGPPDDHLDAQGFTRPLESHWSHQSLMPHRAICG